VHPVAPRATGQAEGERTVLEAGIYLAVVVEAEKPSEAAPADTTEPVLVPTAVAAPPAWDPEAAEVVGVGGAARRSGLRVQLIGMQI